MVLTCVVLWLLFLMFARPSRTGTRTEGGVKHCFEIQYNASTFEKIVSRLRRTQCDAGGSISISPREASNTKGVQNGSKGTP